MKRCFALFAFSSLIIQAWDGGSEFPQAITFVPVADSTVRPKDQLSDADLEKILESSSPLQLDLLYRVCNSDLAEGEVAKREWLAAFRICASRYLPRIRNMTPLVRMIASQQCQPRLLGPKLSVRDCVLYAVQTADLRPGWDREISGLEERGPRVNAFDSVEDVQRKLAKQVDVFTYNGDNRRPPRSVAERGAIRATGIVTCESGGQRNYGSGFVISTGGGYSVVLTAGHVIRGSMDNTMRACRYEPNGRSPVRVDARMAPRRAHLEENSDERVRKDWGMLRLEGELPWTMPLTRRGKDEIFRLLATRSAHLKLYARHPDPPQRGGPQIQVSDNCELLSPLGRRDLFGGNPHVLYHTCDAVGTASGGLLALELPDGTTEAIGLHRSTANTAGYEPLPNERNDAIPRSDRVSGIALSLASDGSMPAELRRNLP